MSSSRVWLLLAWLLLASLLHAGTVKLAWTLDAYTAAHATGIKVYFGSASGIYGTPVTLPVQSSYSLTGLAAGTWYIAVTSFDGFGETVLSNEVVAVVPPAVTGFRERVRP